jgi:ATP-dependent Lhr-like helicase
LTVPSREELLRIKNSLEFTWEPFFSRFGAFTTIQEKAVPVILAAHDCLLSSRTASGKTEAATAPVVERLKAESWPGMSVLYISPTRALVNDLFKRLAEPLESLGVVCRRRTADSPYINPLKPPQVLITTPESFDALLARNPKMFINVRAILLDEIHLLDGSARGDQVRLLLHRLRALRTDAVMRGDSPTDKIQVIALSATVHDPLSVASRYCIDPIVVSAEGKRQIDSEICRLSTPDQLTEIVSTFGAKSIRKVLVFCGSRIECEQYAAIIRRWNGERLPFANPFDDSVFVHHSSLDRDVRLDTEERFATSQAAICFATSTLELGVDIGDIDLVVLIKPPYSIGSFLQRIGRGNRRTQRTTVLCLYKNLPERRLFELLIVAAEKGLQDERTYAFKPSVIVQQILSYLKQRSGSLDNRNIRTMLEKPFGPGLLQPPATAKLLTDYLITTELLKFENSKGEFRPGTRAAELYEQFQEHSNIDSTGKGIIVYDDLTGRVIGEIQTNAIKENDAFLFGAKQLDVVRIENDRIAVTTDGGQMPNAKLRFRSRRAMLPFDLAQCLAGHCGFEPNVLPMLLHNQMFYLLHGLGDVYGLLLSKLLSSDYGWRNSAGCMALKSTEPLAQMTIDPDTTRISELVRQNFTKFENLLDLGKFQKFLPPEIRQQSVIAACDVDRFCARLSGITITHELNPGRVDQLSAALL